MFDSSNRHDTLVVVDMIDDSIVADPNPVEVVRALKFIATMRARFVGQARNCRTDSLLNVARQRKRFLAGGIGDDQAVRGLGHDGQNPISASTCSQGVPPFFRTSSIAARASAKSVASSSASR